MTPADVEATIAYVLPVPLWGSGAEAADHGRRDITTPSEATRATVAKIVKTRTDLVWSP